MLRRLQLFVESQTRLVNSPKALWLVRYHLKSADSVDPDPDSEDEAKGVEYPSNLWCVRAPSMRFSLR